MNRQTLVIGVVCFLLMACTPAVPLAATSTPTTAAGSGAPTLAASPPVAKPVTSPSAAASPPEVGVAPSPSAAPAAAVQPSAAPAASPVPNVAPAASPAASPAAVAAAAPAPPGDAPHGQQAYMSIGCYACHGTVGQGASTGPKLAPGPMPFAAFQQQVRQPRQDMPRFGVDFLSDQDLADIYAYMQSIPPGAAATSIPLLNR